MAFSLIPLKSGKRRSAGARLHVPSATYAAFPSLARVDWVRIATEDAQSLAEGVLTTESASARFSRLSSHVRSGPSTCLSPLSL